MKISGEVTFNIDELVICRNCGREERYDLGHMTPLRKKHHRCSYCGNSQYRYSEIRKDINRCIKMNHKETMDLINEDKYNDKLFGRNKGFEIKKVGK